MSAKLLSTGAISHEEAARVTLPAGPDTAAAAGAAAECFLENGVVQVTGLFEGDTVDRCYADGLLSLVHLLRGVQARGVRLGKGTKHGYREVVKRTMGRYEMFYRMLEVYEAHLSGGASGARLPAPGPDRGRGESGRETETGSGGVGEGGKNARGGAEDGGVGTESGVPVAAAARAAVEGTMTEERGSSDGSAPPPPPPPFAQQTFVQHPFLHVFLESVLGEGYHMIHADMLTSFPGAEDQTWHVDGGHRPGATEHLPPEVLNIFVALDDVTLEMGPTELRPGTHKLTRDMSRQMLGAMITRRLRPKIRPPMRKGDMVIFDYRTLHRGVANAATRPRPVMGLTFAKHSYVADIVNIPKRSVFDVSLRGGGGRAGTRGA